MNARASESQSRSQSTLKLMADCNRLLLARLPARLCRQSPLRRSRRGIVLAASEPNGSDEASRGRRIFMDSDAPSSAAIVLAVFWVVLEPDSRQ